jgi:16S rRNA (cytosine1402-N4)-methyltransferase
MVMRDELPRHLPVLHTTVLENLRPQAGETVLDVTLGLAGHASSFAEKIGERGMLIGIDADTENLALAHEKLSSWNGTLVLHHANFGRLPELNIPPCDIIFADLGLSSPHLDLPERGFTFRADGPLDMRFDRTRGKTASDLIEESDAEELVKILREYGELQIGAFKLAQRLAGKRFGTTTELKEAAEEIFSWRTKQVLPQVFQALRIAVNEELVALETLLSYGMQLLKPGGRMGILSYHSLEDRLVKHAFRSLTTPTKDPLTGKVAVEAPFELILSKALVPSDSEIADNPRSRSAKFRAIQKRST